MLNIVLFGPPGAGKGTQSDLIIEKYNLVHISTGDLFRKHLKEGTELGKEARRYMDEGNLVPDEVVIGMVANHIDETKGSVGYIFDGFPRTVNQAEALDRLLKEKAEPVKVMIALEVEREELIKRITERGKTSGRTDDQDLQKINNRIHVYEQETLPVARYYETQGKFQAVNGVGSIEEIFENIAGVIDQA
jgi:adenylate kinase